MTERTVRSLSEIASEPTFRTIDGLSIRFGESERRNAGALLFSPIPGGPVGFKTCAKTSKALATGS